MEKTTTIRSDEVADAVLGSLATKSPLLEGSKGSDSSDVAKRCCGHKYELVGYDALPAFLKDNEFILDYYRSEWPVKQALLSAFAVHNETINVWTHLIGFFMFLALTVCAATMVGSHGNRHISLGGINKPGQHHRQPNGTDEVMSSYSINGAAVALQALLRKVSVAEPALSADQVARWPFYSYLCGTMFCLLMSSACHLLACHSEHASYVLLRLDYAGIAGLIVTSFYPLVYYTFLCDPFFRTLYLGVITIFGTAAVAVSLLPVFEAPSCGGRAPCCSRAWVRPASCPSCTRCSCSARARRRCSPRDTRWPRGSSA